MVDIFQEIVRLQSEGTPAALATIVGTRGSTPGREAMRLLVLEDGTYLGTVGGGCLEAEVFAAAREVIRDEKTRTLSFRLTEFESPENGLLCGGEVTVFVEPLTRPTLMVFGGGHISRVLAEIAQKAGFRLEIVEDRESFATRERFPQADSIHVGDYRELARNLPISRAAYLVIVTRGHKGDAEVLAGLASRELQEFKYLGMIGSKVKKSALFRKLREEGLASDAWLGQVRTPVGLGIGARSHEEIAIAIVAEMIQVRRGGASDRS